jgi:hypothetical protein
MIETGKILQLIDSNHFLFQGKTEKLWIGHKSSIGQLEVGKNVTLNLIERFQATSIFKNPLGNYKLVDIYKAFKANNNDSFYLTFNKLDENKQINVTISCLDFNNNILGDYFDLSLTENYVGINSIDNLLENKSSANTEIIILDKIQIKTTNNYYLSLYNNKIITLKTKTNLDKYIGTSILIELYKKYLALLDVFIEDKFYNLPKEIFTFQYSNKSNNFFIKNNKEISMIADNEIINSNNIGKNIDISYFPLYFCYLFLFKESTNSGYKLVNIQQGSVPHYIFVDKNNDDVFAISLPNTISLNNKLGSLFTFNKFDLFLLSNMEPSINTNDYLFSQVLDNGIHNFVKDKKSYFVNMGNFEIALSSIGKYFNLTLTTLLLQCNIMDVSS